MSKVFFAVGVSLDGFIAGPNGGPNNPLGDSGTDILQWIFKQKAFLEHLELGEGGETGPDNDLLEEIFSRTGASIMGKRMFNEGEPSWPENAPFHCPVFVLTHQTREPWERKGGTTFFFENGDIHEVFEKAKKAAGDKDIRISGGANVIQQYLKAGVIDEFILHFAPVVMGKGVRLFDNLEKDAFSPEIRHVLNSPQVTHLRYKVNR